jgi:heme/copper-type cytochrome/quinol oxidase subunit 3
MSVHSFESLSGRHAAGQSRQALLFFLRAVLVCGAAAGVTFALAAVFGRPVMIEFWFPPAFAVSSVLLLLGSIVLSRAVRSVRHEKQRSFRGWLRMALVTGTLFLGVQGYGLWTLLPAERAADQASLGVTPFVLMLSALHALHLSVAVLFLAFVATRAQADRYDHEYYWGVSICAYFWHALGIAWLFILAIFAIAL